MSKLSCSIQIIIGSILLLFGGYLAFTFFNFNTGIIRMTVWRDVVIFALIALIGLIIMIYGIKKCMKIPDLFNTRRWPGSIYYVPVPQVECSKSVQGWSRWILSKGVNSRLNTWGCYPDMSFSKEHAQFYYAINHGIMMICRHLNISLHCFTCHTLRLIKNH